MEVGGADRRGGEAVVARGWCSRGRCGRTRRQWPSVATAWRGGGEVKEVACGGGKSRHTMEDDDDTVAVDGSGWRVVASGN
uniref:DUF834 domain-containing protein n=1 Tax=Oryza glumipatula TaxID=40148 RepID=A0A0E0B895_9ORYZ